MKIVIKCKNDKTFSACVKEHVDAEFKLQEVWYKSQGCIIEEQEKATFDSCDCEHCKSLDHTYHDLYDEIVMDN